MNVGGRPPRSPRLRRPFCCLGVPEWCGRCRGGGSRGLLRPLVGDDMIGSGTRSSWSEPVDADGRHDLLEPSAVVDIAAGGHACQDPAGAVTGPANFGGQSTTGSSEGVIRSIRFRLPFFRPRRTGKPEQMWSRLRPASQGQRWRRLGRRQASWRMCRSGPTCKGTGVDRLSEAASGENVTVHRIESSTRCRCRSNPPASLIN